MASDTLLSGDLAFLNLGDLLQMLGMNGATGILRLYSPYSSQPGLIYFDNGNPIHAICGEKSGLDAIHGLFGWVTGDFSFSREKFSATQTIQHSRMQIILDGLRMLDDGELATMGPSSKPRQSRSASFNVVHGPLVDYMSVVDEERFTAGQQIVVEGSYGNWIWVILEGQVDMLRDTPDGPMKLLSLGEGAFIGNLTSFSIHGHIRSATCVAITDVVLGVLDLQRLTIEYTRMPEEMRTVALSLDRRLRQLTDRLLSCRRAQPDTAPPIGQWKPVSLPEANQGEGVYRITGGQAAVVWQKSKEPLFIARLHSNDVFGRIPFADLGHEPHSASVLADESIQFVALDVSALEAEFQRLSLTFKNFFKHMVNAISVTTMLTVQACGQASERQTGDRKGLQP
jgi:CRP-like cAMP-binding protein